MQLKTYRFFNMGKDHNYLDDARNRAALARAAADSYIPMNNLLLDAVRNSGGRVRASFYISGLAVEQMRSFAPEALAGFRELAATGCVEFLAGTYSNSLSSLANNEEFCREVRDHSALMEAEFGIKPTAFFNTALLYSDAIGAQVAEMGYRTMLAEGARHLMGWKSPDYVYANSANQKLRLLLRNWRLSDDLSFRFGDRSWDQWPLTAEKYIGWLVQDEGETVNLFMDYNAIGGRQSADSGIFDFFRALLDRLADNETLKMATVSESASAHQPVSVLYAENEVTWADEERDLTAWLGNELQQEAFSKLYSLREKVRALDDPDFTHVWHFMQNADNFYWMSTKWFSDGGPQNSGSPYPSSYEAFINYMNVLSDFMNELKRRDEERHGI